MIQIDEAALKEKLPIRKSDWYSEYLDWAIPAFRLCHSGVSAKTQMFLANMVAAAHVVRDRD